MSANTPLDDLRQEIDAIDDAIHDLIIARTKVVERVRKEKQGQKIKIRPARECSIIYRLMERHTGPFPKRELARIWRELIVATLSIEGPFSIGVHISDEYKANQGFNIMQREYCNMIRNQYGSFTPMSRYPTATKLIDAVKGHEVAIGVLAMPKQREQNPWWPLLASDTMGTPRIIGRLPFINVPQNSSINFDALVICPIPSEPTGQDHTFLIIETGKEINPKKISSALRKADIKQVFSAAWQEKGANPRYLYLVEAIGFITKEDSTILLLSEYLDDKKALIRTIGTYGQPLAL